MKCDTKFRSKNVHTYLFDYVQIASVKHILTCSYLILANRLESKQFQVHTSTTSILNYYNYADEQPW